MGDGTGDSDKLERLRRKLEGMESDNPARMDEVPQLHEMEGRQGAMGGGFPWIGAVVVGVIVILLVVALMNQKGLFLGF